MDGIKSRIGFILLIVLMIGWPAELVAQPDQKTPADPPPSYILQPELRTFLLKLQDIDQGIREELLAKGYGNLDSLDIARQEAIDRENTAHLQEIIDEYGWPDRFLVGFDGVQAAFLIAQHADEGFQQAILPLIKASYQRGDLSGGEYALFEDRVRVNQERPQLFGSQAYISDGQLILYPIEDHARVDLRRKDLGLEPLADYVKKLEEMYGMKAVGY